MIKASDIFDENGNPRINPTVILLCERDAIHEWKEEFRARIKKLLLNWRKTEAARDTEQDNHELRMLLDALAYYVC